MFRAAQRLLACVVLREAEPEGPQMAGGVTLWFARRARRIETHSCSDECPCSGKGAVTVCRVKSEQMLVQTARHTSAYGTIMISPMFAQAFCLSVLPAHPCVGAGSAMAPVARNSRAPVRAVDSPSVAGESTGGASTCSFFASPRAPAAPKSY